MPKQRCGVMSQRRRQCQHPCADSDAVLKQERPWTPLAIANRWRNGACGSPLRPVDGARIARFARPRETSPRLAPRRPAVPKRRRQRRRRAARPLSRASRPGTRQQGAAAVGHGRPLAHSRAHHFFNALYVRPAAGVLALFPHNRRAQPSRKTKHARGTDPQEMSDRKAARRAGHGHSAARARRGEARRGKEPRDGARRAGRARAHARGQRARACACVNGSTAATSPAATASA